MATIYLRSSDGDDGDDGSTWALAKATLQAALTAAGAGGLVYMDDGHNEAFTAATIFTSGGTWASPTSIICVVTDTTTPVTTYPGTANIESTNSNSHIYFNDSTYIYGIRVESQGAVFSNTASSKTIFERCYLKGKSASLYLAALSGSQYFMLIETDVHDLYIQLRTLNAVYWYGGKYTTSGAATFNTMFESVIGNIARIEGVDLSAFEGTTALINTGSANSGYFCDIQILNCKLPSGLAYTTGVSSGTLFREGNVRIDACHTADGYYAFYSHNYAGYIQDETTIKRSGGADYDGTNEYSHKIVTNASASEALTYIRHELCSLVVDATIEKTLSVHIAYDSATTLQNDDIWLEVKYHDATDQALGKWARTKPTTIITAPDRTAFTDVSGSETWDGTGGWTNPQEETIEQAITGGSGLVDVYLCVAKPSTTVYADPQVEVA